MRSIVLDGSGHVVGENVDLDGDTAEYLVGQVEQEREDGTFADMDGDSAAAWIIDRLRFLTLERPGIFNVEDEDADADARRG